MKLLRLILLDSLSILINSRNPEASLRYYLDVVPTERPKAAVQIRACIKQTNVEKLIDATVVQSGDWHHVI